MILILAVDINWNIGYKGQMLFKISNDLSRFKKLTEGNIVIMGRKTFESLPGKKALSNRINIVLTTDRNYSATGIHTVSSTNELFRYLEEINHDKKMKNFVIGGGHIVKQLIPYCCEAYITKVNKIFDADTGIPNLDDIKNWKIKNESETYKQDDLLYKYVNYINDTYLNY